MRANDPAGRRLTAMAAYDPRPRYPVAGAVHGAGGLGRPAIVRVPAPANDNRPPFIHVARLVMRLMCLVIAVAAVAVLLR